MKIISLPHAPAALALIAAGTVSAVAEVVPHSLFTEHMVLQQGQAVPVWGTAEAGERLEITFRDQRIATAAGPDGRWLVYLRPLEASSEPAKLRINDTFIKDVLVGEVWVCSGQSNMAMPVSRSSQGEDAASEAEAGEYPRLRLFKVPGGNADERQSSVQASWQRSTKEAVSAFSATGLYFGRALQKAREVPVGLIQSAAGGSNAFSWISNDAFENHPGAGLLRDWFQEEVEMLPEATKRHQAALEKHRKKMTDAQAAGNPLRGRAARPPAPPMGPDNPKRPTSLYNAMIAPLQPFAIKGAVWYQGEANARAPWAPNYTGLMRALIESWRADWNQPENREFPFYVVQLPNYAKGDPWGWPVIRESMLAIWKEIPNTGMVVTIDVGDPEDIHPTNKTPVGDRLAVLARGHAYGEEITYSGPLYSSMTLVQGAIELHFARRGGRLRSAGGGPLKCFTIAGEDMEFVEAEATIDGDQIVVRAAGVPNPVAVRYAWQNNPEGANLANAEGLMASPFRTDRGEIPPPEVE